MARSHHRITTWPSLFPFLSLSLSPTVRRGPKCCRLDGQTNGRAKRLAANRRRGCRPQPSLPFQIVLMTREHGWTNSTFVALLSFTLMRCGRRRKCNKILGSNFDNWWGERKISTYLSAIVWSFDVSMPIFKERERVLDCSFCRWGEGKKKWKI